MATKYVRAGAVGSDSGDDWTNAYPAPPAVLTRGNLYYFGDGVYPAYDFDDAESGTTLISWKKATIADHGTNIGWLDAYGDGQAVFGQLLVRAGYLSINGVSRSADWWSDYGIKFTEITGNFGCVRVSSNSDITGITFEFVEFEGGSRTDPALAEAAVYAFTTGRVNGLTVSKCKTSLLWPDIFVVKGDDLVVEYCAIDENFSTTLLHGQIVAHHDCNNVNFRFNLIRNPWGTAIYTVLGNGQTNTGLYFYGNVIWQDPELLFPDGISALVEVIQTATLSTAAVHLNTMANLGYNPRIVHVDNTGTDRTAYDNLFYKCGTGENVTHINWTVDYTWYEDTIHDPEPHEQIGIGDPFIDMASANFRLLTNTNPGLALAAKFNTDLLGNLRTTWSRGAYEFQDALLSIITFNLGNLIAG